MTHVDIKFTCPYCNATFFGARPEEKVFPPETSWRNKLFKVKTAKLVEMGLPNETECMPYTRDIGRFDPKTENAHLRSEGWSTIGSDFLKLIRYDLIGILRISHPQMNVLYRVARCDKCNHLFDVFLNYTPDVKFENLWPHVFSKRDSTNDAIRPYESDSIPTALVHQISKRLKSNNLSLVMVGFILFLIGLIPSFLGHYFGLDLADSQKRMLVFLVASIGISILIAFEDQYIHYLATTQEFHKLFHIFNKPKGVGFWKNYSLCRLVGVQKPGTFPRASQVDLIAGGLSIILLIGIRFLFIPFSRSLTGLIYFLGIVLLISGILTMLNIQFKNKFINLTSRIVVLGVVSLSFYIIFMVDKVVLRIGLIEGFDLLYWVLVAFFFGRAAMLGMNTALYVLQGLSRIKMDLSLYDQFANAKPLHRLQIFSSEMLLTLFLSILAIITLIITLNIPDLMWIFEWLKWGIIVIFGAIGIAINNKIYLILAEIFGLLSLFLSTPFFLPASILGSAQVLFLGIILQGLFFTTLIGYQILQMDGLVAKIKNKVRAEELENLDAQILRSKSLFENEFNSQPGIHGSQTYLETIERLMVLRDKLNNISENKLLGRRIAEFLTPVISSILFPVMVEVIKNFLIPH